MRIGILPVSLENIASEIVDSSYKVHSLLGPGLLENVYETCLDFELRKRGFPVVRQVSLPIKYESVTLDAGLRMDMVVDDLVVVEIKAVEQLHPLHTAQLLTYLKLSGKRLGFLINFNVPLIRDGIKRVVL